MLVRRFPSLPSWSSAFRELDEARRDMERMFDSVTGLGWSRSGVFPPINVTETGDAVLVRAELPGIEAKNLDVTVENNTLTIAGERQALHEDGDVSYHRREREWGTFRRSFSIPCRVEADRVKARYVNGILTVEMPKAAEARPKQIAVQAGA